MSDRSWLRSPAGQAGGAVDTIASGDCREPRRSQPGRQRSAEANANAPHSSLPPRCVGCINTISTT